MVLGSPVARPPIYGKGNSANLESVRVFLTAYAQDDSVSEADEKLLDAVFDRIGDLLEREEYVKFTWMGSCLQKHFGHITIARQDCYGSVDEVESAMW